MDALRHVLRHYVVRWCGGAREEERKLYSSQNFANQLSSDADLETDCLFGGNHFAGGYYLLYWHLAISVLWVGGLESPSGYFCADRHHFDLRLVRGELFYMRGCLFRYTAAKQWFRCR